jgi:putative ABC transport system permease protein
MKIFREIVAVTRMNLLALPQRIGPSLVTVIGVACVVGVMISVLSISDGLMRSADKNVSPDVAVVLNEGAQAEYMGAISRSAVSIIGAAPQVKHDAAGRPMVRPQAMIIVEVHRRTDGGTNNIIFRGLPPGQMPEGVKLIEGRMFRPAVRELIVGKSARDQFKDLNVGDRITLRGSEWSVVGAFEAGGGLIENTILGDADTVLAAFDRNAYQSVRVKLNAPGDFQAFKDTLTSDPQLSVEVKTEKAYVADQLEQLTALMNFVGYFVGGVMAVGAVFGALTTMYSAVDARAREIATLRAIGFGGLPVVVSVMVEALILAIPGALIGVAAALILFNGDAITTVGLTFRLAVTPNLILAGVTLSLVIALIGGFAPSIRAARLPVATALRA